MSKSSAEIIAGMLREPVRWVDPMPNKPSRPATSSADRMADHLRRGDQERATDAPAKE